MIVIMTHERTHVAELRQSQRAVLRAVPVSIGVVVDPDAVDEQWHFILLFVCV